MITIPTGIAALTDSRPNPKTGTTIKTRAKTALSAARKAIQAVPKNRGATIIDRSLMKFATIHTFHVAISLKRIPRQQPRRVGLERQPSEAAATGLPLGPSRQPICARGGRLGSHCRYHNEQPQPADKLRGFGSKQLKGRIKTGTLFCTLPSECATLPVRGVQRQSLRLQHAIVTQLNGCGCSSRIRRCAISPCLAYSFKRKPAQHQLECPTVRH